MKSFQEYVIEAHVYDGVHTEIKKDRIDFHIGGTLVHSHKGDYSNPTKVDAGVARSIARKVHVSYHNKIDTVYNAKEKHLKLNGGSI
jgi:hypothetical protein